MSGCVNEKQRQWIIGLIINSPLPVVELLIDQFSLWAKGRWTISSISADAKSTQCTGTRDGGDVYKGHCSLPVLNIEFTSEVAAWHTPAVKFTLPAQRFLRFFDPSAGIPVPHVAARGTPLRAEPFPPGKTRGPNLDRKTSSELVSERQASLP